MALWLMPVATLAASWLPARALACPDCWVGREARAGLWTASSVQYVALGLLPFIVTVTLCLLIEARGDQS
ncbi:MAG TPA: hypothetical protein VFZ61_12135 [Polyangiales bacterium]